MTRKIVISCVGFFFKARQSLNINFNKNLDSFQIGRVKNNMKNTQGHQRKARIEKETLPRIAGTDRKPKDVITLKLKELHPPVKREKNAHWIHNNLTICCLTRDMSKS